jgi:hypothetical protein
MMKSAWFRFFGLLAFFFPMLLQIAAAQPRPQEAWGIPRFHDPSTSVRCDETWYVFSTGTGILKRRSSDLKKWTEGETRPYLGQDRNDLTTGGGGLLLASDGDQIPPGHPSFIEQNGKIRMFCQFYDRQRRGFSHIGSHTLGGSNDDWPKIQRSPLHE